LDEERRLNPSDPSIVSILGELSDLKVKVAKLEERQNSLEKTVEYLKKKIDGIDERIWLAVSGILASIILQIILKLL
jgi:predicted  nucleic acid-binding Zn-ribbon protein